MRIAFYSDIARARFANLQAEIDMGKKGGGAIAKKSRSRRNTILKAPEDDPSAFDPANWDLFERQYPDSLLTMY